MAANLRLGGVIPANLLPFRPDYSVDYEGLRSHIRWLMGVKGVTAITANGHAAEVSALDRKERQEVLADVLETVNGKMPVIAGLYCDGTHESIELARDAMRLGASALLMFPPMAFDAGGVKLRPEMAVNHFKLIADAVDLPMVCFEYPRQSGFHYSPDTLRRLLTEVPNIVAVKDWSYDIVAYEENLRVIRSVGRHVAMLTSFSKSLLGTLVIGADGILSGNGSVIADLQAELFAAVQAGDLKLAREINDRLFPLTQVFYADPMTDQHNRMKEALVMLGRLKQCTVRPPLAPITGAEKERIHQALVAARLLNK